ncbi:putative Hexosaminidase D-like protein, partial [Naja naja]
APAQEPNRPNRERVPWPRVGCSSPPEGGPGGAEGGLHLRANPPRVEFPGLGQPWGRPASPDPAPPPAGLAGAQLEGMALHRSQKLNLLRLAVLLTVALAGIKFFFRDSFTLDQRREINGESHFWGGAQDVKQPGNTQARLSGHLDRQSVAGAPGPELKKLPHRDFSSTQMRLVHLDLKGAAPKVSYLEQGELEILRSPYAYSEEDIMKIQELAGLNKLEIIPLVQTFGHVEHEKYRHLREVERFPNSFNPHLPETLALLKALLTQVLSKHPHSSWVHIGADEVFHLGEGLDSKNWMSRNGGDTGKMYLNHIREVVQFIANQPWGLQVLLWDDMLRKVGVTAIQDSGIAKHASPVLWFYAPDFDTQQIGRYIEKYAECGFSSIWFASAFKGTTGPAQAWTPYNTHLQNHLRWLKVIQSMEKTPSIHFQGIEASQMLPKRKSWPSLASRTCIRKRIPGTGAFPGSDIYRMVEQVDGQLKDSVSKVLEDESSIKGWFSPYHRKHQFGNPRNMESFGSKTLRSHMESIYFPDTVEEWMEENVNPHMDRLREFVRDFKEVIRLNARPKTL